MTNFTLGGLLELLTLCFAIYGMKLAASQATNQILQGDTLFVGDTRTSLDGSYRLTMQADCILVLYKVGSNEVVWRSGTPWAAPNLHCCFILQEDGNGVTSNSSDDPRQALSATNTWEVKDGEHRIVVENNGIAFMLNAAGQAIWNTSGH